MPCTSNDAIARLEKEAAKRRNEIRNTADNCAITGTAYYVSALGHDNNDGMSPDTPWRTLKRVSTADLQPGDGVFFRRGDLFRGEIIARSGVTYAAYGVGEKPRLYGWDEDLADPSLWVCAHPQKHIWRYTKKILDPGTLVFNEGEAHCRKLIPSYINGRFVCREDESKPFEMVAEMTKNLDLYWHFEELLTREPSKGQDFPIPLMGPDSYGDLYLRCDQGNPGQLFRSIEALTRRPMFRVSSCDHVRIDNLCLKYIGLHAVQAGGHVVGLYVTNCEIGWIGGTIQHYLGTDPNYPQGGRGTVTRFGNGVEIYGGCEDYEVSNCYIYQVYDAGITHQITTNGKPYSLRNIRYLNNLVEYCVYAIEYFLEMNKGDTQSLMEDIEMKGNFLRLSGYGWGQQRHNTDTPALIKGWSFTNAAKDFVIEHNIFDRCAYRLLHLVADEHASCPRMAGNTYVQSTAGLLGQYGGKENGEPPMMPFGPSAEETIHSLLGDTDAAVCLLDR